MMNVLMTMALRLFQAQLWELTRELSLADFACPHSGVVCTVYLGRPACKEEVDL